MGPREPGDEMAIADLEERGEPLDDVLGRPDRLVLPAICLPVALEHRGMDPLSLRPRVADDDRADPRGPFDLGRVAPHRLAVLDQDRFLARHVLEAATDVVRIAVARHQLQRDLLAASTDEDGQSFLDRHRVVADGRRRVTRAGCGGPLPVEHAAHDRQRLAQPAQPFREATPEGDAVGDVLLLEPGTADAQDRPTAGDVVESGGHLRGQGRLPERVCSDHQPDPHMLRRLRPGRQRQPAFQDRPIGAADDGVEVVPRPERVIAQLVRPLASLEQERPRRVLVPAQGA